MGKFDLIFEKLERRLVFANWIPLPDYKRSREVESVDASFSAEDGTSLHGLFFSCPADIPCPLAEKPTILYFHGNAGDAKRWSHVAIRWQNALGADVLIVDYRGYGKSEGTPSEEGLYLDSRAAYKWLLNSQKVKARTIIIAGQSLGGAIAIELATSKEQYQHCGLVLESTFSNIGVIGKKFVGLFSLQKRMKNRFPSLGRLAGYKKPTLISHGGRDLLIPLRHGTLLSEVVEGPVNLLTYPRMGHPDRRGLDYERSAKQFFSKYLFT